MKHYTVLESKSQDLAALFIKKGHNIHVYTKNIVNN